MEMEEHKEVRVRDFVVGSLPTLIYIPDFITEAEQAKLLHHIYEVPASRWKTLKNRRLQNWGGVVHEKGLLPQDLPHWLTKITERICLQTGLFTSAINHVLINEYFPDQGIMPHQDGPAYFPAVAILSLQTPTVMNFTPHQKLKGSMDEEEDKVEDLGTQFELRAGDLCHRSACGAKGRQEAWSILLMPCSLFIFKDQAYSDYLHGIKDSSVHRLNGVVNDSECLKLKEQNVSYSSEAGDCTGTGQSRSLLRDSTRVSLTCRLVLKVRKNLFKL